MLACKNNCVQSIVPPHLYKVYSISKPEAWMSTEYNAWLSVI